MRTPWYISARAVRDYCALRRLGDPNDDDVFVAAEEELAEATCSAHYVRDTDGGHQMWRLPRRTGGGLRLIVSTSRREEGNMPQLIAVKR